MAGTSAAQSEAVDTRRGPTGDSGSDSDAPARPYKLLLRILPLSPPCLKMAEISSNVLFFVSGTCLYVNIQKIPKNTLNGRNV